MSGAGAPRRAGFAPIAYADVAKAAQTRRAKTRLFRHNFTDHPHLGHILKNNR